MAKLNGSNGSVAWGWQRGSGGNDYVNGVTVDAVGDVYACGAARTGLFDGNGGRMLKQGGDGENSAGSGKADVFLVKVKACVCVCVFFSGIIRVSWRFCGYFRQTRFSFHLENNIEF